MQSFTAKYSDKIQGVLSGFDRLIFWGSLRKISYTFGLCQRRSKIPQKRRLKIPQ